MANPDLKTTPAQKEAIRAAEEQFRSELKYPVWLVKLEGDDAVYLPRPDPTGEMFIFDQDADDGRGRWVEKGGQPVILPRMARVEVPAKTRDQAAAKALSANPECHTVVDVEQIREGR